MNEDETQKKLLNRQELLNATHISSKSLNVYEKAGYVKAEDVSDGVKYYSEETAELIKAMQNCLGRCADLVEAYEMALQAVPLKTKRKEQASTIKDSDGSGLRTMDPTDMKTHPTLGLLPIDEDTLEEITKKMALYGYYESQPILLGRWPGLDHWVVIDGHTRRQAAIKNGIEKVFYVTREFESESAALEHAMSLQNDRRITEDRHIFLFIEKYDTLMVRGGDRRSEKVKSKPTGVGNEMGRSASAQRTASILGCNYKKVEKVRRILKDAVPSIMNAVKKGKMTINQAYNATIEKGRKEKQKLMGEKLRSARIKFREINLATLEELKGDIHEHVNIAVESYFRYLVKTGKLPKKK